MKNFFVGVSAITGFVLALFVIGYPSCWVVNTTFCLSAAGVAVQGMLTMFFVFVCIFIPWIVGVAFTEEM